MRATVAVIWICFLLQAIFYCLEQPIWEGLDEWAHFAYVQNLSEQGRIPAPGDDTAIEVSKSLQYLPLPYQPGGRIRSELMHDQYWRLSADERAARETALLRIPARARVEIGGAGLYEAQQAPLYYLLMVPVYRAFSNASLAGRLLAVRIASVIIASLVIPLVYATAKELFGAQRMALLITCLAASLPGLLMDISRAGNESLAVVLGAAMTLALLKNTRKTGTVSSSPPQARAESGTVWRPASAPFALLKNARKTGTVSSSPPQDRPESGTVWRRASAPFARVRAIRLGASLTHWLALGVILGLGLLTKAYFLAFLPIIPALALMLAWWHRAWKKEARGGALALLVAVAMSAAWYARMERLTGSLSGEKNVAAIEQQSLMQKLTAAAHINWLRIVYDQVYSQLWLGGWSFLRVKPWMYGVFEVLALLCVAGLGLYTLRRFRRRRVTEMSLALAMSALALVLFEPGLFYQALAVFMLNVGAFGPGWYFYVLLAPELLLLAAGAWALLGKRGGARLTAAGVFFAVALNLYTMHLLLMPYYTGLIAHSAYGSFHAAHIGVLADELQMSIIGRTAFVRTQVISPAIFAFCWIAYVLAAVCPAAVSVKNSYFFGKARHK